MSMVEEYSPDTKPEKEQSSRPGAAPGTPPRECWLDLGRVVGLFFIVLFHASGNGAEFPLFFQRVPFLFMAAAYFVGRRKIFDWRHSPCRYVLFYLAWNGAAFLEAFFRHWIYLSLGHSSTWDWSSLPWKLTGVGTTFPYDGPLWFLKYVMALSMLSPLLFALGKRKLLIPATIAVLFSVVLFPELNALFSDPPRVPWADALAFFMLGFCLSSLTLGEIKLFLKKTGYISLPVWAAIAWMNHCGVISTETLHTLPCWIPGILGLGSLCVLLTEKTFFLNIARACAPLFFFIYAIHCLILPYLMPLLSKILLEGITSAMVATVLIFAGAFFLHRWVVRHYPGWEYLIFAQKQKKPPIDGKEKERFVVGSLRSASMNEPRL